MKLFIWNDPFNVMYGGSSLCVVAENVDDAKKLALSDAAKSHAFGRANDEKVALKKLGKPTYIYDLPCAVWDWWSE